MKQIIQEFENILSRYSDNQIKGSSAAIGFIVRKYGKFEADSISTYISKRLGIAEWIVRADIKKRYRQM